MNLYFKYIVRIIILIGLIYLFNKLIFSEKNIDILNSIKLIDKTELLLTIGITVSLQFVNWAIEALKFKFILSKKNQVEFLSTYKAIYAGTSTALFTPDRLGNFIGRLLYLKNINKAVITASSMLGNLGQLITTILFALISLILVNTYNLNITLPYINNYYLIIPIACSSIILVYIFLNPNSVLKWLVKFKWFDKHKETFSFLAKFNINESVLILAYSFIRYGIFIIQFYILMNVVGIEIGFIEVISFTGLLYLYTTFIPSPIFGNLGTREVIALLLLSNYDNSELVLLASLLIWLINIILPSIIGSYFILKMNANKT